MRLYLLVLGASFSLEEVKNFIDGQGSIADWFYSMPNSIFLVSEITASEIYDALRQRFTEGRMFLTEVARENRAGFLPRGHWTKIKSISQ